MDNKELLRHLCIEGAVKRDLCLKGKYGERLEYELGIIFDKGFEDYFLMVAGIVDWARKQEILIGVGRGSAVGSLVAYLLGITQINPLEYGLLFERFLNPARADNPDIDTDYQASRRGEVIKHVQEVYGQDHVAQIKTCSLFKPKVLIRDLGRILNIPLDEVNMLSRKIRDEPFNSWEEATENKDVQSFVKKYPKVGELAPRLEGCIRQNGTHAAGLCITPKPINEYMGIEKVKGRLCTSLPMQDLDALRFIKQDVLGLKTLDVIKKTLDMAGLSESDLPLEFDDPLVYRNIFQRGNTLGVFQFETSLLTNLSTKLKINDFETLYATTTIARPGSLRSGEAEVYIRRHLGEETVNFATSLLEPITKETYGLILFQEQVMETVSKLGGLELTEAEKVRKLVSKSKGSDALDVYREKFLQGCDVNGIDEGVSKSIWEILRQSGAYSFNKSHAVAYSAISFQTAFLKTYYPREFLTALIGVEEGDTIVQSIRELRELGYDVEQPDVNLSEEKATIFGNNGMRMGLSDVNAVSTKAVEEIIKNQPYNSFDDFMLRTKRRKVNTIALKNLIQAGAFDRFGKREDFYYTVAYTERKHDWNEEEKTLREEGSMTFSSEKGLISFYENPLDEYIETTKLKDIDWNEKADEVWVKGIITEIKTKKSNTATLCKAVGIKPEMAFVKIDDATNIKEGFVAPEVLHYYKGTLKEGEPFLIKAHVFGGRTKLYVDAVIGLRDFDPYSEIAMYAKDGRKEALSKIEKKSENIGTVMNANYRTSKNGNNYINITLRGGLQGLCFHPLKEVLKAGDIIAFSSDKAPFINIEEII